MKTDDAELLITFAKGYEALSQEVDLATNLGLDNRANKGLELQSQLLKETVAHFQAKELEGRIVPSDKIQGQRLGQLISNALYARYKYRWHDGVDTADFHDKIFYLENDELEAIVQRYVTQLQQSKNGES